MSLIAAIPIAVIAHGVRRSRPRTVVSAINSVMRIVVQESTMISAIHLHMVVFLYVDMRGAGGEGEYQEQVFHWLSHLLLSEKCSCRLPSWISNVGLPFL